jgi:hypothetical protein
MGVFLEYSYYLLRWRFVERHICQRGLASLWRRLICWSLAAWTQYPWDNAVNGVFWACATSWPAHAGRCAVPRSATAISNMNTPERRPFGRLFLGMDARRIAKKILHHIFVCVMNRGRFRHCTNYNGKIAQRSCAKKMCDIITISDLRWALRDSSNRHCERWNFGMCFINQLLLVFVFWS